MSGIGIVSLMNNSLTQYSNTASNALRVASVDTDFISMRRQVLVFSGSGDQKVAARIQEMGAKLLKDTNAVLATEANPERKATLQKVIDGVRDYLGNFDTAVKSRTARDQVINERMNVFGPQARTKLSEIAKSAMDERDYEAASHAGVAQEKLLLMRLDAMQFLDRPEQAVIDRVKADFNDFNRTMEALIKQLQNPARQKLATEASDLASRYFQAFVEVTTAAFALNTMVNVTMAEKAEMIDKTAHDIVGASRKNLTEVQAAAEAAAVFEEWLMSLLAFGALLIGAVFAWFIARGIVKPVNGLTGGMRQLAAGNFDVVLPGLGRKDEIGDIAGAVEEFKRKLEEKMRLDAEKEQEIARREQAERDERARQDAENARMVANVVAALGAGLENFSRGNLTYRVTDEFADEYKKIQQDFNAAIGQLQETVKNIATSSAEISNAASEISTSTTDLSQRTEEQAASLEQTSASMEQMAATVRKNAENANHADKLARETRDVADRGGAVVAQAVSAMAKIEESSRKISDIISVIDEIARQTNLLALNAAVEAARAGEAGRGFAVVASEVRSLAQRSSQAAKDITDLITDSAGQVKDGVTLVNNAGASLTEIVASIKNVAVTISEIASASAEQAGGIEQINKALNQMDEITQQNSALVEENAATAKTLEGQQSAMNEQVSFFSFKDAGSNPTVVSMPAKKLEPAREKRSPVARRGERQASGKTAVAVGQDWQEF